jgi:hypothetical protein
MFSSAHHPSFPKYTLVLHCTPSPKQSSNSDNFKTKFLYILGAYCLTTFLSENTYFAHCKMFRRVVNSASKVPLFAIVVIKILWIWHQQAPLILVTSANHVPLPRRLQFTHCENLKFHVRCLWRTSTRTWFFIFFLQTEVQNYSIEGQESISLSSMQCHVCVFMVRKINISDSFTSWFGESPLLSVLITLLAFLHQQQSDDNNKNLKTINGSEMFLIGCAFQIFFPQGHAVNTGRALLFSVLCAWLWLLLLLLLQQLWFWFLLFLSLLFQHLGSSALWVPSTVTFHINFNFFCPKFPG